MTRLICIKNPAITISAPDELVSEVGGNCWQIGGPQPLTYPKHLWKKENHPSLPSNLDEAADCYKDTIGPEEVDDYANSVFYETFTEYQIADAFKAGAEWMAGQGITVTGNTDDEYVRIFEDIENAICKIASDSTINVQIRK